MPSTELTVLEQPSGTSGADNCAGNIEDSAASEDNISKPAICLNQLKALKSLKWLEVSGSV